MPIFFEKQLSPQVGETASKEKNEVGLEGQLHRSKQSAPCIVPCV